MLFGVANKLEGYDIGFYENTAAKGAAWLHTNWNNFTLGVQNRDLYHYADSIVFSTFNASCSSNLEVVVSRADLICTDGVNVNLLFQSVASAWPVSVTCDGVMWTGNTCNGVYRLAAGVSDICSLNHDVVSNRYSTASLLAFTVKPLRESWPRWSQSVVAMETSVVVSYNMSGPGRIYCAAFPASYSFSSVRSISSGTTNFDTSVFQGDNVKPAGNMTIDNLAADTEYRIACYTRAVVRSYIDQFRSPISAVLDRMQSIKTLPGSPPILVVNVPFSNLIVNELSQQVDLSFSFALKSNSTVTPYLKFIGSDNCDSYTMLQSTLSESEFATIAPRTLSFGTASSQHNYMFVETTTTGCFGLGFQVGESSQYPIVAKSGKITIPTKGGLILLNSISRSMVPLVSLNSVQFSNDGVYLNVVFSDNTDSGASLKLPGNFPCDALFSFVGVAKTQCTFLSPKVVQIFSTTNLDSFPLPNDIITLLSNTVKPYCKGSEECSSYAYLPSQSMAARVLYKVEVSPAITAPNQISAGSSLTLDLSSSVGRGGRRWASIVWTVSHNYTTNRVSTTIQTILNNGSLAWDSCWSGSLTCDTLPASVVEPGVYSLHVELKNFLGFSSFATRTIEVSTELNIPQVYIVGPTYRTIPSNYSLLIRAAIPHGSCDENLGISWVIYRDDEVDPSVIPGSGIYNDIRSIFIDRNVLIPNHEYRFEVTVFCGNKFSSDDVTRYVIGNDILPVIKGGDQISASLTRDEMIFDGSLSTKAFNDGLNDFTYQWGCIQTAPLDNDGCKKFYSYIQWIESNATKSILNIRSPSDIFIANYRYLISLQVSSESIGISREAQQMILMLPPTDISLPKLSVIVPSFNVQNSFGYTINATVSSDSSFVAVWQLLTSNQTLVSKAFINGGMQFFPAILANNMIIPSRSSFLFRLLAFPITTSCSSLLCANKSSISYTTFSVSMNQPPILGMVGTSPAEGKETTLFTLFANNWHDEDLPMFYTFYRQNLGTNDEDMIRHRMQLNVMQTSFMVSTADSTVQDVKLRTMISDYYGAATSMISSVKVYPSVLNVSKIIERTEIAMLLATSKFNPEAVLPVSSIVVDALFQLNCTHSHRLDCRNLITADVAAIHAAIDKYNAGFFTISGLVKYLEYLTLSATSDFSPDVLTSIVSMYNFANNAVLKVGFIRGDGNQLVSSMLRISDRILHMYLEIGRTLDINGEVNNSTSLQSLQGVVDQIQDSVSKLASMYFPYVPFSQSQTFLSDNRFNITMLKSYWSPHESDNGPISVGDLTFSKNVFPDNRTSSFAYLGSVNLIPNCNDTSFYCDSQVESKYVEFSMFTVADLQDVKMQLSFRESNYSQMSRRLASEVANHVGASSVIYRNCSDLGRPNSLPVTCAAVQTGGVDFVFPTFLCNAADKDKVVAFTCPVYEYSPICTRNGEPDSVGSIEIIGSGPDRQRIIVCDYAVADHATAQNNNDIYAVKIGGTYTFSMGLTLAKDAALQILPGPIVSSSDSSATTFNYVAIVVIAVVAICFAAFLYYRMKIVKETTTPDFAIVPETSASYVDFQLTSAKCLDVEIIIGKGNEVNDNHMKDHSVHNYEMLSDEENGLQAVQVEVQMVRPEAYAFPVLRS